MSPATLTLQVPSGAAFEGLAGEVASRVAQLCGVDAAAAARFDADVTRAVHELAARADWVDCAVVIGPAAVDVTLTAGADRRALRQTRP